MKSEKVQVPVHNFFKLPLTSNEMTLHHHVVSMHLPAGVCTFFGTSPFSNSLPVHLLTAKAFIHSIIHPCSLTRGTGLQTAPPRWACWPGPRPRPSGAWWPDGASSPTGTSPVWARYTSWAGWWCVGRCAGNHAWLRPWHPPWSWPGSWGGTGDISTN